MAEKIEGQVIHHYQRRLEEQVRALVLSLEGVNQARAQVFLETKGGQPDFGGISKIKVWVGLEKDPKGEYKVVEEIKVRIGGADCEGGGDDAGGEYQVPGEMREEITSVLTAFYTVDPQRVSIYALEGSGPVNTTQGVRIGHLSPIGAFGGYILGRRQDNGLVNQLKKGVWDFGPEERRLPARVHLGISPKGCFPKVGSAGAYGAGDFPGGGIFGQGEKSAR